MKNTVAKILRKIANRLSPVEQNNGTSTLTADSLTDGLFNTLKKLEFDPNHIVDVGANHGNWTRRALGYFPNAHYTLLEPQPWLKDSAADLLKSNPNVVWHSLGAGAKSGTFPLTIVDRDDSCNFRMTNEEATGLGFAQLEVPVVTLDELLGGKTPSPDFIKIDAEGLDLQVLQGATRSLAGCEVLLMEASVMCKSMSNTIRKVIDAAHEQGFVPFDVTDLNRTQKQGSLWLIEIAFVKGSGRIASRVTSYS